MYRALALLFALVIPAASAVAPVRTVDIEVEPYYSSAKTNGGQVWVGVGSLSTPPLAAGDSKSLRGMIKRLETAGGRVTPMSMMVLAIRLYDAGLRDDAAFWYFAASDRYFTAKRVIDFESGSLLNVGRALDEFIAKAGPVIDGYALSDVKKRVAIRTRAAE